MTPRQWPRPKGAKPDLRIVRAAATEDAPREATIYLYDYIGWPFIEARELVPQLQRLDVDRIHLRLNSPGGDVFDGVTLYNAFRQHAAEVITHIDGLAASIASIIALAGDEVRIASNAFYMIHEPTAGTIGTADELRQTADILDKVTAASLIPTYARASGAEVDAIAAWMAAETWFDAEEAMAAGFATAIEDGADLTNQFDLSGFAHAPAALAHRSTPPRGGGAPTVRDLERLLRDAGCSRSVAKAAAAAALKAPSLRDAEEDGLLTATQQLVATMRPLQGV